jgi:hypothetical protein
MTFWVQARSQAQRILECGRWGFPQVWAMVSLVSHVCWWFVRAPNVLRLCTNQLVVWFVQVRVNN